MSRVLGQVAASLLAQESEEDVLAAEIAALEAELLAIKREIADENNCSVEDVNVFLERIDRVEALLAADDDPRRAEKLRSIVQEHADDNYVTLGEALAGLNSWLIEAGLGVSMADLGLPTLEGS